MDQTQVRERAGIRHRRLHTAAGDARAFRSPARRVFEGKKLKFSGKVGTGCTAALLRNLHARFQKLRREKCPFADLPEKQGGRWSQNITPAEMKRCTWLEPALVCQVKFTEWTFEGKLRHPVFLGLRDDKSPHEVIRETASPK